jgi:hypothetical protein
VRTAALPTFHARQTTNLFCTLLSCLHFSFHALCLFCSLFSSLSKLFTMPDAEFFAGLCHVQLQTDRAATPETRSVFSSKAAIQHLIEESSLTFAPGLAGMIQSPNAPSVQQLRASTVVLTKDGLRSKWIVYLQYYRKGPHWYICCGKSTNLKGAQERIRDYEKNSSTIPQSIKDLVKIGFQHMGHTILAAVDIPFDGADRIYTSALVTMFEATFATGF